jgi:hypothetical protein
VTSFFDDATSSVLDLPHCSDEEYLRLVAAVEKPVIDTVLLNTGDREFPDDLREKVLNTIATRAIYSPAGLEPTTRTREHVLALRYSEAVACLHLLFHALASRRIKTRFGFWTDSPTQNLVSRKCHDEPEPQETTP